MFFDPADRPALKAHAKESIRQAKAHGIPVTLVTIVFLVMQAAPGFIAQLQASRIQQQLLPLVMNGTLENMSDEAVFSMVASFRPSSGAQFISLLLTIFLSIVAFGYQKYCLNISRHQHPGEVAALFDCFRDFGRYFVLNLLIGIFVFLWSLLFVIPGIIAGFRYSQAAFLMMDDPDLSPLDAIRQSKELMRGHKWEYFVMTLSFLGWEILVGLTAGILGIWIQPYMETTYASYYNGLIGWQPSAEGGIPAEPQPVMEEKEPEWWEK